LGVTDRPVPLGIYLIVFLTTLFRAPKLDIAGIDADLEEEEEEGLLASTGRRFNATWQDITGRSRKRTARYGATDTTGDGHERNGGGTDGGRGRDSNW
jgi:LMBR1 domain-containing protein 1